MQLFYILLIATGVLFFIVLNFKNIKYSLIFILIATPFYVQIQWLWDWSVYSRFWYNLVILILLLIVFIRFCVNRKFIKINRLDKVLFITLFYGFLEIIYTYFIVNTWFTALNGFRLYYFGIFLYFVTRFYVKNKEDIRPLSSTMLILIIITCIELLVEVVLLNSIAGYEIIPWIAAAPAGLTSRKEGFLSITFHRPYGIFFHHQTTAVFIAIGALITLIFYLQKYEGKELLFKKPIFYLMLLALFLSTSRTGIFSFLLCLLLIIMKYKLLNTKIIVSAVGILVIFNFFGIDYLFRYLIINPISGEDPYFQSFEFVRWRFTIMSFLFGNGFTPGAYETIKLGFDDSLINSSPFLGIRSEARILLIFSQTGLIGGSLFLLQNIMAYKMGITAAKKEEKKYYAYLLIGFSFSILMVLFSTSHYIPINNPGVQCYYYIILGIISSLSGSRTIKLNRRRL